MPELMSQASKLRRRARWLGLRTLRRVPRAIGETDAGEPIFDADGIHLALRRASHHFRRMDPCSRCGRETVGQPIVHRVDMYRPGQPVICEDCVRASSLLTERPAFKPPAEGDGGPAASDGAAGSD